VTSQLRVTLPGGSSRTVTRAAARALSISVVVVGVGAAAGCSTAGEEAKVRTTVTKYLDAIGRQRYEDACKLLHQDIRRKLGADCARGLAQRYTSLSIDVRDDLDDINVSDVAVDGGSAVVAPTAVLAASKISITSEGKNATRTKYHTAPDVTGGVGFILKKVGDAWLISGGL
jgi:hypothetical protein